MKLFQDLLLLLLIFTSTNLWAQIDLNAPIPIDSSVRIGMLPNGMRYYIRENKKPENRAELRLAVNAGSLQESDNQLGVAHFVEHMAFNGTKNFPKQDLVNYLESTGTRFGADLNAYTSFAETVYMLQARTDSLALLQQGLLILEDWAHAVTFDETEIEKERGVVLSEWRSRLSPEQRMQQQYYPVLYKDSRYAKRLPIGDPDIIENIDPQLIKQFYQDWYRPELMAVVAVGDFDARWMEMELIKRFCNIPKQEAASAHIDYAIPRPSGTSFAIISDKEAAFTNAQIIYKHPHQPTKNIQDFKQRLTHTLYNRMLGARLFELQQQPKPPFTFASSGYGNNLADLDTYFVSATTGAGKSVEGLKAVLLETRRATLHGFNVTELVRQKAEILLAAESELRESDKIRSGSLAGQYVYHFLDDNPIPNAEQYYQLCKDLLPLITLADVNQLPNQWLASNSQVIIVTGPEKQDVPLPTQDELRELLIEIEQSTPLPYEDQVSDEPILNKILPAKSIASEKHFEELDVWELQLENGVKVVLKPTDFQNDEIRMNAFSPGGHSLYPDDDFMNASSAAQIVDFSGVGPFDVTTLQKKLAGKKLSVSPYISEMYEGFNGYCSPDDLETMLQLTYLYFTEPRKDSNALQSIVSRQKSIVENMMANPYYYFNEERSKIKYDSHPRRLMTKMADLEQLSIDKAYAAYRDRFADASDFTFVFVGNIDPKEIKPLLATYLGNLPNISRKENWRDVHADLVPGRIDTTIVRGQAPKAIVELDFHGDFDYFGENTRYHFYSMLDLLRIKLRESMREDKGGVYGVSVNGVPTLFPKQQYRITISFYCEPNQADSLIQTALADIEQIKQEGAASENLQKIKETQKQSRTKAIKENSYWSGQLTARYQNGLSLEGILLDPYLELVDTLHSNAIQQAAQQYFTYDNFMKIVLLPESTGN